MAAIAITVAILIEGFEPAARDYVIKTLHERYHGDVQLGDLQISLFPTVHATGENLTVRTTGARNGPPLVHIRRFVIDARFIGFFRAPKRIRTLRLEGLEIHIPPGGQSGSDAQSGQRSPRRFPFILETVTANRALLEILPHDAGKDPLTFHIEQLTMHTVGLGKPMRFHVELNNPKPPGFIHSDGEFGPWEEDDPSATPVNGKYTFSNADLGVFKSIAGTLSSSGAYRGRLDRLEVEGTTDVPDFALTSAGQREHLRTRFKATVDGTDGDTVLHPVQALLGESAFEVSGPIERNAFEKGKEVNLTARSDGTGLRDFLRLAIKGRPPMLGQIKFDTTVKIPPGETPVIDRLGLDGRFALHNVTFTSEDVQEKIASLSHHAQGDPKITTASGITADFSGRFLLRNGTMSLPRLEFDVPGARVTMDGSYQLESGLINFTGTARFKADISEMTTGVKSILLRPIDPLFKHGHSGTVLPIRITGTRGSPSFRLDLGRLLHVH